MLFGGERTLGHSQIRPDNKHKLALLVRISKRCLLRVRLLGLLLSSVALAQTITDVGGLGIGPVRRVIEDGIVLVDIRFLALDGILLVGASFGAQLRGDEVAADRVDTEHEA